MKKFAKHAAAIFIYAGFLIYGAQANAAHEIIDPPNELEMIKIKGVLRVGVSITSPKMGYIDPITEEHLGLEVDIARRLANELGVVVDFVNVTLSGRYTFLDRGKVDMSIYDIPYSEEIARNYDLSPPYFTDYTSLLVKNSSNVRDLSDLIGKRIGVMKGSNSAEEFVRMMIIRGDISGRSYNPHKFDERYWHEGVEFVVCKNFAEFNSILADDDVVALCHDKTQLIAAQNFEPGRSILDEDFAHKNLSIATRKGSSLTPFIKECINKWMADGTIKEMIYQNGLTDYD